MSTIYDVSELAGVSLATVSRVMNGNTPVSKKTKERVLQAMLHLDYRPNTMAKGLASKRSKSVGVLISELHGPFFGGMMSAIEAELRKFDVHVIIAASHGKEKDEKEAIEFLLARHCDALILFVEGVDNEYLLSVQKSGTPLVLLSRQVPQLADQCITLDNELGGYVATQYLLEQGHRTIAYISGPLIKQDALDRYRGHIRALTEYSIAENKHLFFEGDFQEAGGAAGMTVLLNNPSAEFSGLVCANDEMAAGAMSAARDAGLTLPSDLSIVGFDDVSYAKYIYPSLTTVHFPIQDMARMAAHWVLQNVYSFPGFTIYHHFKPSLVKRNSVLSIVNI